MREWRRQSHVKWYCRYHVVIVPKYRQKAIFGRLRKDIGRILRELCEQFEIELIEGHAMRDHVHLCLSIPPKYSVATAIGRLKGEIGDSNSPGVSWPEAQLYGVPFLVEGLLREHRRARRRDDSQVYPESGGGRSTGR